MYIDKNGVNVETEEDMAENKNPITSIFDADTIEELINAGKVTVIRINVAGEGKAQTFKEFIKEKSNSGEREAFTKAEIIEILNSDIFQDEDITFNVTPSRNEEEPDDEIKVGVIKDDSAETEEPLAIVLKRNNTLALLQNNSVQAVVSGSHNKKLYTPDNNPLLNTAVLQLPFEGGVSLEAENFRALKLNGHPGKLCLLALAAISPNFPTVSKKKDISDAELLKHGVFTMTLTDYMQVCGLTDRKTARENVNIALAALSSIKYKGKMRNLKGKDKKPTERIFNIVESYQPISNKSSSFTLRFTPSFLLALRECAYPTYLQRSVLELNEHKHPYARNLQQKLNDTYRLNNDKRNAGIISVEKVVEYLNALGLPTYEEVMRSNRHFTDRIVKKVEDNLEALIDVGSLKEYYYTKPKGEILTDEELENLSYEDWIKLNINYELPEEIAVLFKKQKQELKEREEARLKRIQAKERKLEEERLKLEEEKRRLKDLEENLKKK